jgi:bla regulator protein BlaR1
MTENMLSLLRSAGSPIANHLWQSTIVVLAVSILTLLFGKNRARIRYGLWLAASLKFLVPFSALVALGTAIPISKPAVPVLRTSVMSAAQIIDQPFNSVAVTKTLNPNNNWQHIELWLPLALALIWTLGFATVLLAWFARWRQLSKMLRRAPVAADTREIKILRRIENKSNTPIRLLKSRDLMEPGVFGVFRPVLFWPAQLSDRLEDAHLEAILVHEVAHVHRCDNLTALIHMVVEAIFWFHPFVWWIERKMIEERERACDEAVLHSGRYAEIYADSLLKVGRFCAEPPLPCVSGTTGGDLSKRIRSIMTSRSIELGIGKRLMLSVFGVAILAGPVAFGLMQQAPPTGQILHATGPLPSFEVVSVKPSHSGSGFSSFGAAGHGAPLDRFIAKDVSIKKLIGWAYAGDSFPLPDNEVSGGPNWIESDRYDIDAKLEDAQVAEMQKLSDTEKILQVRRMVQSLLATRFKLAVNDTTVTLPAYALVISKGGLKMKESIPCSTPPPGFVPPPPPPPPPSASTAAPQGAAIQPQPQIAGRPGELVACNLPVKGLVRVLQLGLDRAVLDRTGLTGNYTFQLKWTPEVNPSGAMPGSQPGAETAQPSDNSAPSIFTALQEQLGLKLEPTKGPVEGLEIVHIEKPSEN